MDVAAFERVNESFREFHAFFAAAFGRKQWREHSRHYLQALLVQSQERRNAENLSETVPASARAMQRFLTEARWDDDAVIGRLQEYLGPKLAHTQAVWVFDGSDLPVWRRLVLPVHLRGLAAFLGHTRAVAGHVKLQDHGMMHHPVDGRAVAMGLANMRSHSGPGSRLCPATFVRSGASDSSAPWGR